MFSKNIDTQATIAPSVEHATSMQMLPRSSLRHSLRFGQSPGTFFCRQRIGKKFNMFWNLLDQMQFTLTE